MVILKGSWKEEVVKRVRDEVGEKRGVEKRRRRRRGKGGEAEDGGSRESAWH